MSLHDPGVPSYGKIHALGSRFVTRVMEGRPWFQEKVDGSQFSFAVLDGRLRIRSKGREIYKESPDKMFAKGVEYVQSIQDHLVPGWIYRGEYLRQPKHNTLAYARIPHNHIALFDVMTGVHEYRPPDQLADIANTLGLEAVPVFLFGTRIEERHIHELLTRESFLGGQTVEGVVIKNYEIFCEQTGGPLMAKYVSEAFKEIHCREWKTSNPTKTDIIRSIIDTYKTPARWEKAVFRLRDSGELEGSPRDIGKLIKEVWPDIVSECQDEIKETLYKHFEKSLARGVTYGFPEWYKQRLLHEQFEKEEDPC